MTHNETDIFVYQLLFARVKLCLNQNWEVSERSSLEEKHQFSGDKVG